MLDGNTYSSFSSSLRLPLLAQEVFSACFVLFARWHIRVIAQFALIDLRSEEQW